VPRSEDEATVVARIIASRIAEGERPEDFAILYRQNAQSRLFEEALRQRRVPYTLIGGTGFYDRMEVKDLLSYLRLTANPSSRQDFERVVNVPSRKLGDKTIAALREAGGRAGLEGAHMLECTDEELFAVGLKGETVKKLRALGAMLAAFRSFAHEASARDVALRIIEDVGYKAHLERTDPQTAEDRLANVAELVSSIAEHEERLAEEHEGSSGAPTTTAPTSSARRASASRARARRSRRSSTRRPSCRRATSPRARARSRC
jgi:DNA helicase-2/ATP-dependent DNA helicase PcrA